MNNAAKQNTPELRFKGFSDEWDNSILGTFILSSFRGNGLSWNDIDIEAKNKCILYGNLYTDYGMSISKVNYATNNIPKNAQFSKFGDILIPSSDTTPTGLARASCIELNGVILGGDINVLRPKPNVDGVSLSYNINANRNLLIPLIKGTTVKHLYNEDIKNIKISVSQEIKEQTKVGELFKNIDELITNQDKKVKKLENIKKALLEKMFPQNGATTPRLSFKGFSDDWEENELGTFILSSFRGNGLSWNDIDIEAKHKCILYGNLYTDYGMSISKVKYATNNIPKNAQFSKFGDVLIPSSDTTPTGLARASCIELNNVILGGDINVLRPKPYVDGISLSYNINANKNLLIPLIKGTTVKHLYNEDIKNIKISVSNDISEQTKIGNLFKNIDELITNQDKKLEKLKNIKTALLGKMFV